MSQTLTIDAYVRLPHERKAKVTAWAKQAKAQTTNGRPIIDVVLTDATHGDLHVFEINDNGDVYPNADHSAAVDTWLRGVSFPPFPVDVLT